jgi:hypothetical protein
VHSAASQRLSGHAKQVSWQRVWKRNCTFRQPWLAAVTTAWQRCSAAHQPSLIGTGTPARSNRPPQWLGEQPLGQLQCNEHSSATVSAAAPAPRSSQPALLQRISCCLWRPRALASRIWAGSLRRWDLPSLLCLQRALGAATLSSQTAACLSAPAVRAPASQSACARGGLTATPAAAPAVAADACPAQAVAVADAQHRCGKSSLFGRMSELLQHSSPQMQLGWARR